MWTEQTQKYEALFFHAPAVSEDGTTSVSELQPGSPAAQAEPGHVQPRAAALVLGAGTCYPVH